MVVADPQPRPGPNRWLVRTIAAALAAVIWFCYVSFRMDQLIPSKHLIFKATATTAVPLALVVAYAIAASIGLFLANRQRLHVVFRPNPGRLVGAVAPMLLTTFAVVDWIPLGMGMLTFAALASGRRSLLVYLLLGLVFWYPVACLIISGTKSRLMRFGLFCLMPWSVYSAVVLWSGVGHPFCC